MREEEGGRERVAFPTLLLLLLLLLALTPPKAKAKAKGDLKRHTHTTASRVLPTGKIVGRHLPGNNGAASPQ